MFTLQRDLLTYTNILCVADGMRGGGASRSQPPSHLCHGSPAQVRWPGQQDGRRRKSHIHQREVFEKGCGALED